MGIQLRWTSAAFKVLPRETHLAAWGGLRRIFGQRENSTGPRHANAALRFEGQIPPNWSTATATALTAGSRAMGSYHIVNYTFANLTANPQDSLPAI